LIESGSRGMRGHPDRFLVLSSSHITMSSQSPLSRSPFNIVSFIGFLVLLMEGACAGAAYS
jgi:hypothetical protein